MSDAVHKQRNMWAASILVPGLGQILNGRSTAGLFYVLLMAIAAHANMFLFVLAWAANILNAFWGDIVEPDHSLPSRSATRSR